MKKLNKQNRDRLIDREQADSCWWGDWIGVVEGLSKIEKREITHGHGQQCGDCQGLGVGRGRGEYSGVRL